MNIKSWKSLSYGRFEDGKAQVYPLLLRGVVQVGLVQQGPAYGQRGAGGGDRAERQQLLADLWGPAHGGEAGGGGSEDGEEDEEEDGDHGDITGQTVTVWCVV